MQNATLHYIFDPLCGWCHGAAPLVDAAQAADGFHVRWLVFEPDHRVANVLLEELEQARFKRLAGRHLLEEDQ